MKVELLLKLLVYQDGCYFWRSDRFLNGSVGETGEEKRDDMNRRDRRS